MMWIVSTAAELPTRAWDPDLQAEMWNHVCKHIGFTMLWSVDILYLGLSIYAHLQSPSAEVLR